MPMDLQRLSERSDSNKNLDKNGSTVYKIYERVRTVTHIRKSDELPAGKNNLEEDYP